MGETLDAGGIEDVVHRLVAQRCGKGIRARLEHAYLPQREIIRLRIFSGREMGINRLHLHPRAVPQEIEKVLKLSRHESQAVHACIQLDMDGKIAEAARLQDCAKSLKSVKVGDAGLQAVVDDLIEKIRPGGKHENGKADTGLAEFDALKGQRNRQVIGAAALHHRGELHRPVPVCIGLHQDEKLGGRLQAGAEVSVVLLAGRKVELQPREIIFRMRHSCIWVTQFAKLQKSPTMTNGQV